MMASLAHSLVFSLVTAFHAFSKSVAVTSAKEPEVGGNPLFISSEVVTVTLRNSRGQTIHQENIHWLLSF
jgi:hypothetical protein